MFKLSRAIVSALSSVGAALAFQSAEPGSGPATDWDACLLLC
ncbi:hypothetical protein ACFWMJ_21075 [Streptomyces hawaiiensis]